MNAQFQRGRNELVRRLTLAMREVVGDERMLVEDDIRVPVGRDASGNVTVRSKPGEPPRAEEKQLLANVDDAVSVAGTTIRGTISSSRPETPDVPAKLEFGDPANRLAPRPYMSRARNRLVSGGLKRLADAYRTQA